MKKLVLVGILAMALLMGGCESTQQKIYDMKADTFGTNRVAKVYNEAGTQVSEFADSEMRFELVGERSVRLWLGDKNKKVMVINMGVTIEDK